METAKSLYQRLGGYDAIAAVCNDLLPRCPTRCLGASGNIEQPTALPARSSR